MKRKLCILIFITFIASIVNAEDPAMPKPPQLPGNGNEQKNDTNSQKSNKEENAMQNTGSSKLETKKIPVTSDELQNILDRFSAEDKKVLKEIQTKIANWPENLFSEIREYREFVISARNKAEKKYQALSPEAKEAINIEKTLKEKLSPGALKLLHDVELQQ